MIYKYQYIMLVPISEKKELLMNRKSCFPWN